MQRDEYISDDDIKAENYRDLYDALTYTSLDKFSSSRQQLLTDQVVTLSLSFAAVD